MTKPTQKLLDFDAAGDVPGETVSPSAISGPDQEAFEVYDRLADWLCDARGNPVTALGYEVIDTLNKALLDGKRGYTHRAEDLLETLKLRNGRTEGDDIVQGLSLEEGANFHADVDDVLDLLHERMFARGR